jgi:Holin of 3TMs, for gene-transfer release
MALDPLTAGLELGGKLLDKLFPDPEDRAAAQIKLVELQQSGELAQIAVNTEEAKNENLFVSGWRPFIGWVCGFAFAYHFILLPMLETVAQAAGYKVEPPVFNMDVLTTVLMGMLGLGSLRTIEKVQDMKTKLPWQK